MLPNTLKFAGFVWPGFGWVGVEFVAERTKLELRGAGVLMSCVAVIV